DIWEISLSSIVDGYIAAIEQMRVLDLSAVTEFLVIAAVLLELKARRLLPLPDDGDTAEDLALWEERDLLLARLLECKTFKDASAAIARLMEMAALSQPRSAGLEERFAGLAPDPLASLDGQQLRQAAVRVLAPRPLAHVNTDHVAPIRASVADAVAELVGTLPDAPSTTFRRLTAGTNEPLQVIVYFLALLELYKRGVIELDQPGKLAELHVTWLGGAEGLADAPVADAAESPSEGLAESLSVGLVEGPAEGFAEGSARVVGPSFGLPEEYEG
ncbi:MAG TPA: ScpA family protein, partial [Acidimicrobiales bacterium]|nr:ScpA family protein [Acidimicrobiales bacterium]